MPQPRRSPGGLTRAGQPAAAGGRSPRTNRWVDDAFRDLACGYRLCSSALVGLPGVRRLARRRFRRSAFADVHATRAHLEQATERASAILTLRQALALRLFCDGQPMTAIASQLGLRSRQHPWAAYRRPAVEALTREFLAQAQAEFPPN
ncbi:MAG: hypothetical protein OXP73_06045 [Chloroflexota bacterium]|nr:hypothetical protein [Chloroflexota bacterium]